ncbi:heavy-metal-associated domain-containing protein [Aquimarina algicola]|uniref:Heavy-metal-associated domain-containing protein n=1 Tax=Aquimarina algicola TaxID=2589995 RepID=A0A504JB06_9FLAO|nr:heavy-metal-associated domain-containing protein [Aquimarina algicola]TPN83461.1 heavy-metal-associated domain-containing protein [Aquimarina algicola]
MNTLQFKTNINCGNCVSKVSPFLDQLQGIKNWKVDTDHPNKILSIESNGTTSEDVKNTLQKIGFLAEEM